VDSQTAKIARESAFIKRSEVKVVVLKKKFKAVTTEFSGRKIPLRLWIKTAKDFTHWK
jgi:hypothetical protein